MSKLLKSAYTQQIFAGTMDIPVVVPELPDHEPDDVDDEEIMLSLEEERALVLEECMRIREQTEKNVNALLEDAKANAAKICEEARNEGYQAGFEEGRVLAQAEFTKAFHEQLAAVETLIADIEQNRISRLRDLNETVVQLAMESVRMLLQRELELKEPNIESIVSNLIQYVIESTQIEVRVNPDDAKAAMDAHPVWNGMKFGIWEVVIVPDTHIERGGCEIRSHLGRVDARIETELELLESSIRKIINENLNMAGEK